MHELSSTTSDLALQSYINEIKEYLTKNNITDFTKFEVSLHKDKLKYIKWDYPNIEKPINIITKPIAIKHKFPQTFYYTVEIGSSKVPYKYTSHEFSFPFLVTDKNIHAQVSLFQNTYSNHIGHDDVYCNIRSFSEGSSTNILRIEIDTFRIKQEGWSINHRAYLTIVFTEKILIRP